MTQPPGDFGQSPYEKDPRHQQPQQFSPNPQYGQQYPQYPSGPPPSGQPPSGPPPSGQPPSGPGGGFGEQFSQFREPGFFASLFDLTFSKFITPRILGILYALLMVLIAIGYIVVVISAFTESAAGGIAALILGPIFAFVYLIFARVLLEFAAAMIRTAQNTSKLVDRG